MGAEEARFGGFRLIERSRKGKIFVRSLAAVGLVDLGAKEPTYA